MELKLKKENISKIITIILIGLLLLIVVIPMDQDKASKSLDADGEAGQRYDTYQESAAYYEDKLNVILEKSYGEGTMEVMVHLKESSDQGDMYDEKEMQVDGVLIVADVEDEAARGDIAFAVCALFDLPAHKVAVIKK